MLATAFLGSGGKPQSSDQFPVEEADVSVNTGMEAIHEELLRVAKRKSTVYYSDIAPLAELDMNLDDHRMRMAQFLDRISTSEHEAGRPLLSAVVIGKGTNRPGKGFFELARRLGLHGSSDDRKYWLQERQRVHDYWA